MKSLGWWKPLALLVSGMLFVLLGQTIRPLSIFSKELSVRLSNKLMSIISKIYLLILNVKVVSNKPVIGQYFIVSNHMSYLDVLILSSVVETSFVTSVDMAQKPIQKMLFSAGQCVLVDRKNTLNTIHDVNQVIERLQLQSSIAVFPEATTSNGPMKTFKSALFEAPLICSTPVLPVTLEYTKVNGKPLDDITRELVCYYVPGTSLVGHIKSLALNSRSVEAKLTFHEPIEIYDSRKSVCQLSEKTIRSAYAKEIEEVT